MKKKKDNIMQRSHPFIFLLLLWFGWHLYDTSSQYTVAWDPIPGETRTIYFEAKAERLNSKTSQVVTIYPIGVTTNTFIDFVRPVSGHFRIKVRSCLDSPCQELRASQYSESTNPATATVNGVPMGWAIYFKPKAASGLKVSQFLNIFQDDET